MSTAPAEEQPQAAKPSQPVLLRFFFSLAWGSLAIVLGAAAWGLLAYFTNSVYSFIAIILGLAVAAAIVLPLSPIHKAVALLFLPAAVGGTLLSILLGETLFQILVMMREYQASFPEALGAAVDGFQEILALKDTLVSLGFGLIGALIGFFATWKDL
ncbi:MAG: hypothetical protein JW929_15785 [Anaerolineales bacterium]|nr:hypothetical protein [Anaerolineales bacterium]